MKNIKIRIKDENHSKEVQEVLFKLGGEWRYGGRRGLLFDKPFLYATVSEWNSYIVTHSIIEDEPYFEDHENQEVTIEDLKQMLKEKTMEQDKRPVQITKEQAQEMIENGCEISKRIALDTYPELKAEELPKRWEDQECVKGFYINGHNMILTYSGIEANDTNRNTLPNTDLAEVQQVQPELITMRNIYRDGWEPPCDRYNWSVIFNATLQKWDVIESRREIFTFPSKEVAEEFLENFEEQLDVWAKIYA